MSRPKSAVLLVRTAPDWRPDRVHSVPPDILSASFYARSLSLHAAIVTAAAYNLAHLQPSEFEGQWALPVASMEHWKVAAGRQHWPAKGGVR